MWSRGGIHVWKVAVKKAGEEPVLLEVVKHPRKTSFHHLSWNSDGRFVGFTHLCCTVLTYEQTSAYGVACTCRLDSLLAAYAKNSSSMFVFDAIHSRLTELQSTYQPSSLHWSPTGEYLFATTKCVASTGAYVNDDR